MIKKSLTTLICFVLIATSGCYTARPIRTVEKTELDNSNFHYGDWVLIGYLISDGDLKWRKGKVQKMLSNEIILEDANSEIRIPINRIVRVHFLKKKFNPGGTVVLVTGLTLASILIISLIHFAQDPILVP